MELILGEIAQILKTESSASPEARVRGYSIDSRTLGPGDLFFALPGKKVDGHDFVNAALAAGAAAVVVNASRWAEFPAPLRSKLLAVPEPLQALQTLAAEVRRRWGGPVIAVTGSTGKTTTKQMIATLLETQFRVLQNEGNLNNHIGLPLSLLRLEPETEVGIFEMAMSGPGEICLLANLAAPDLGVVTNVAPVHLEFFPDVEAIAKAKSELIEALGEQAWAVLNADDPRVSAFSARMPERVLYFGITHSAHFWARGLMPNSTGGSVFTLPVQPYRTEPLGVIWKGKRPLEASATVELLEARFHLPLLGRHNVLNLLAALAACYAFGIPPSRLTAVVDRLRPAPLRGEVIRLANGALVVNDCYNSNPEALEAALTAVASLPAQRRIAALGGMMELGPSSETLHYRCGQRVGELGFQFLLTVGEAALPLAEGARAAGLRPENLIHLNSPEEAGERLRGLLQGGDVVLLKASRSVRLEKAWDRLQSMLSPSEEISGTEKTQPARKA
ncbi:MAG: UDP-N-acetylmuramoyl-tripeptide--D-alanyl-D-alanine ligase [Acidobacteria bacterium]|nr:UDP-N-acetylmuramoyl-tripeptide--D-alanyl-D-alanine ligase [Acidobacteriota bacterium]